MLTDTSIVQINGETKRLIDFCARILIKKLEDDNCSKELRQYIEENRDSLNVEIKNIILQYEE